MKRKVSIISALYGSYELNQNFIEHLFLLSLPLDYEIVVITDGIYDNQLIQYLLNCEKNYKNFCLIQGERVGYSKANNRAVQSSKGEYLVFINNDVFPEKNAIEKMVHYMETNNEIGVIQGLLLYASSKRVQSTGHIFGEFYNYHALEGTNQSHWLVNQVQERQGLSSAFYLIKKSIFLQHKGFDEFYYNAWDGLDLSLSIHFSGYKCIYYPRAIAYHIRNASRKEIVVSNEAQQTGYFWSKWSLLLKEDVTDLIKLQLPKMNISESYLFINAVYISSGIDIVKKLGLSFIECLEIKDRFNTKVELYQNLSFSVKSFTGPLLFLVNSVQEIAPNKHWIETRNNKKDIVIDLRGNIEYLIQLLE